jgi:hypothetical protein
VTENLTDAEKAWNEQLGVIGTAAHKPGFLAGYEAAAAELRSLRSENERLKADQHECEACTGRHRSCCPHGYENGRCPFDCPHNKANSGAVTYQDLTERLSRADALAEAVARVEQASGLEDDEADLDVALTVLRAAVAAYQESRNPAGQQFTPPPLDPRALWDLTQESRQPTEEKG